MHIGCVICEAIEHNDSKDGAALDNVALAAELDTSEATIRRHRKASERPPASGPGARLYAESIRDAETGSWHKFTYDKPTPEWPVVQPAQPVEIYAGPIPQRPTRVNGLKFGLKGGDTQIGFRALADGSYEPFHDDQAMALFTEVARMEQPETIVILGDFLDLPAQGRWVQEAGFARTTQMALDRAYEFLATLRAVAPRSDIHLIEGNHDKRLQGFIETNALAAFGLRKAGWPDSWPVMSIPNLLRLDELNITYYDAYPAATYWDNDFVRNTHGTKANSRGSTTAQYANDVPHLSLWVGHTHRVEITYKTVIGPRGEPIETFVANPGCLCRTDGAVPSVHGALHANGDSARIVEDWQQGIGVMHYNDTEAWPEVYRIRDGRLIYRGQVIDARDL